MSSSEASETMRKQQQQKQRGLNVPRLAEWRLDRVMTQQELADAAGIGRNTIVRAERGDAVSLANVRKLAKALRTTTGELRHDSPSG
jgi:transcriptional regulator with XRE-family HTH domain